MVYRRTLVAVSLASLVCAVIALTIDRWDSVGAHPSPEAGATTRPIEFAAGGQGAEAVRSLVPTRVFEVVWGDGRPAAGADVYSVDPDCRAISKANLVGVTDAAGTIRESPDLPRSALAYAASAEDSHAAFQQMGDQHWRCVLERMHCVTLRLRLESGMPFRGACAVLASQVPWAADSGRRWFREAANWLPNPLDKSIAVHVAQASEAEVRLCGLAAGHYAMEVQCAGHVACRGINELQALSVPGGPYEVVFRPVVACIVGVDAADILTTTSYKVPKGLSSYPPYGIRALRRMEEALRERYPADRWLVVAAVDEGRDRALDSYKMSVRGCSAQRGLWEHEARWQPIAEVVPETVSAPIAPKQTVPVQLILRDHTGHPVDEGHLTLVPEGEGSVGGVHMRFPIRADRVTHVPRDRYRLRATCHPLEKALADVVLSIADAGPVTVEVPEPLLACRVRIISGAMDCGSVRVTIKEQGGAVLWSYACEAQFQPIAWVPHGRVEVVASTPGWLPVSHWVDLDGSRPGRPIEIPLVLQRAPTR